MLVREYIGLLLTQLKQNSELRVCGLEQWAELELTSVSNKLNELNQPWAELELANGNKLKLVHSPSLNMLSIWAISSAKLSLQEAGITREQILAIRQLIAEQLGNKHVPSMRRVADWLLSSDSIEQTVAGHIAYWLEQDRQAS